MSSVVARSLNDLGFVAGSLNSDQPNHEQEKKIEFEMAANNEHIILILAFNTCFLRADKGRRSRGIVLIYHLFILLVRHPQHHITDQSHRFLPISTRRSKQASMQIF